MSQLKPVLYLRAVLYWIGVALFTVLHTSTLPLTAKFLSDDRQYRWGVQWNRFNLFWLQLTCGLKCRVEGLENLPEEPCIAFVKHQSSWETFKLPILLPPQVWVLKESLLKVPFFGWAIATLKPIAIDRTAGRKAIVQMIKQGKDRLANNRWIVIFPEGTRVKPGVKERYKMGGALLAEKLGAKVVPVAHNAGEFWPRHSFIKWPGEISVVIGPAIDTTGKKADQINSEAEAWIEAQMAEISNPSRFDRG